MEMTDNGDKKRKYLLFKKDDGRPDHLKPCAFFASADGCKNGSKCRFMHEAPGSIPQPVAMAPVPTPVVAKQIAPFPQVNSSLIEEATPKKEKKKRRTNEFLEQDKNEVTFSQMPPAITTVIPPPMAMSNQAQNSYEKLLEQQRALEQQLKNLSAMMNAPVPVAQQVAPTPAPVAVIPAPTSSKKDKKNSTTPTPALQANKLFPASQPVVSATPAAMPFFPTPVMPIAPSTEQKVAIKYESGSDDEDFLFKAVNHALDNGRNEVKRPTITPKPATASIVPSTESAQINTVMSVISPGVDNSSFPFVDPSSALKALETSGTAHATHGPGGKNKKKDIFASPPGKGSNGNSAPVALFDPSAVNFAAIDWNPLLQRTQSHKRFKQDYSFPTDQTWITSRPLASM
jgi:hypothetical protein